MMTVYKKGALSEADILRWLTALRGNCYIPESGFAATAVFRVRLPNTEDYYFAGVNSENIEHRLSIHAEEAAIAAMVAALGRQAEIAEGWVMGSPKDSKKLDTLASCCGKCRQQIAGFAAGNVKIHYMSQDGKSSTTTVDAFLPDAFTFRQYIADIDHAKPALPLHKDIGSRIIRQRALPEKDIFAWLKEIDSVDYVSHVSQSIVIKLDNGAYVAGAKIEEAAFNGLNAAQSALAIAISEFGACKIQEAWVYTKGHDKKEIPHNYIGTLTMSALQTLLQCAVHDQIPIHFLSTDHNVIDLTLLDAARIAPTSSQPFHKKPS